ncbi:uncharacterized protein A4U43_C05F28700 [Asparagus officinalis]|uniref:RING-type E3 ubiquitin transferase n=1 Tax=Asparagus officinalis TaxID=4686 RepID=A0A5P1EV63_ASPOF|nr:E3 ubiquitin-protein ligase Arkadia-like [Asparagus officinalis]XP_020265134.1 E3 ubiquitin-protein ligase Arkadia-like [Asparagus officinalis]XP_020265135.1 E3 ubiquitin-protein ligase Arkadia-like [Asparagus officinalis]ONK69955.1 uncharacterized protein A4U43_C05F28700 [Asparagus officinalis]
MGQRTTLCTQQLLEMQSGQDVSHIYPDRCIRTGQVADYTNQSVRSSMSTSGSTMEQGLLFRDYNDRTAFYGSQYNGFQRFQSVGDLGLGAVTPPNFCIPSMLPSSSRNFPAENNGSFDHFPLIDKFGMHNEFADSTIGVGKRKNVDIPPGNQHSVDGPASSSQALPFLSLNCGLPQWEQSYEPGVNQADSTNIEHPGYQEVGNIQTAEGSHRMSSRSSAISLQPEPAYFHPNYVLQATHMGHALHPASNVWMSQFGTENNADDRASSNWIYNHPTSHLHGRCLHSNAFGLTNMGVQAFPDTSSTANAGVIFSHTPQPGFQHLAPVQTMQHPSYGQVQMQAPSYQHPFNPLHPVYVNPTSHGPNSGSRFPYFPSGAEQIFRPRHLHHATPDFSYGGVRILSSEDAAVVDNISGFSGGGNMIDQHEDMRLDIDEMSYEELLALEEQIGNVKTGLTEESIIKNLKTSVYNSQTLLPSDKLCRFSEETDPCIICQVEYEEDEIIGTLDCGHNYHGDCIKQWLLVKNLCPICKKTALAADNSEG